MASLTLTNVVKHYGSGKQIVPVIHGVNAEIRDGEFIVIVGPSGCGKSTLLRMVAGLEEITGGTIAIGERVVNNLEPARRDIAMVFQNYALYPHMSVFDNMAYGLKIAKVAKDEIKARVDKAAKILELGHLLERKAAPAFGRPAPARGHGPRHRAPAPGVPVRRAAVQPGRQAARADPYRNPEAAPRTGHHQPVRDPRPGGGHDARAAHDRHERRQHGAVRHAEEVYHTPASTFVASFIGSPPMNLLNHAPGAQPGTTLGIRPEHLDITADGGWAVQVETVELLGAERLVYGRVGDEQLIVRIEEGAPAPQPGDTIHVTPRAHRLHTFDAGTGKRL